MRSFHTNEQEKKAIDSICFCFFVNMLFDADGINNAHLRTALIISREEPSVRELKGTCSTSGLKFRFK